MRTFVFILFFGLTASFSGFGDRLTHGIGDYTPYPITVSDAISKGYKKLNQTCDPNLGIGYGLHGSPVSSRPTVLFFTPYGQIAGIGVHIYGNVLSGPVNRGYYRIVGRHEYFISASFRPAGNSGVCSSVALPEPLGTQVVINQGTINVTIPLNDLDAKALNYTKGACIDGMGYHWIRDLATGPKMSGKAANLLPVVPMYHQGKLSAIFITTTAAQQSIFPPSSNYWDKIAIPNFLMCHNFCGDCHFSDTNIFSTMHLYFGDAKLNKCPHGTCTLGCCDK